MSDLRSSRVGGLLFYGKAGIYIYMKKAMLYLRNTTESQVLFVPKSGANPDSDLVFKAVSTIDLDEVVNQVVIDLRTSDLYHNIAVTLPADAQDGEYEYSLMSGDTMVASGLLVIGENFNPVQHEQEITYRQYETE